MLSRIAAASEFRSPFYLVAALLLFFLSAALYFFGTDRPIYARGEGREGLVVQAMIREADYLLPLRNGEKIPSKPPMFHWLAAAAAAATGGLSERVLRFPSVMCGAATVALFFLFCRTLIGSRRALLGALLLGTMFQWGRSAAEARVDMVFSFFVSAATCALFKCAARGADSRTLRWELGAVAAGTAAILAKGPAGVLLPWTTAGVYSLIAGNGSILRRVWTKETVILARTFCGAVLGAAVWYYAAYLHRGLPFVELQLFKENLTRLIEVSGEVRGHERSVFFAPVALLVGCFPWSILFPVLIAASYRRETSSPNEDPFRLYAMVWLLVLLLVVTVSKSKRIVYLLPAYPAVAYLLVDEQLWAWREGAVFYARFGSALLLSFFASALTAWIGVAYLIRGSDLFFPLVLLGVKPSVIRDIQQAAASTLDPITTGMLLCALLGILLGASLLRSADARRALWSLSLGSAALLCAFNSRFFEDHAAGRTPKEFVASIRQKLPEGSTVYRHGLDLFSATYYFGRNVPLYRGSANQDEVPQFILSVEREPKLKSYNGRTQLVAKSRTQAADGKRPLYLHRLTPVPHIQQVQEAESLKETSLRVSLK